MVHAEFQTENIEKMREATERLSEIAAAGDGQEAAAEEIALRVLADARRNANVDTGRLRSSIEHEFEMTETGFVVRVGSNVTYAKWQEIIEPYLRPAWTQNESRIEQILIEMIENAAEEAGFE